MAKKKTETVVVTWRCKEALRRRLEAAAAHNEVSVNAEITRRIEESFTRAADFDFDAKLTSLTEKVDRRLEAYERYQRTAEKVLELAQAAEPINRTALLELADAWQRLADQKREGQPDDPTSRLPSFITGAESPDQAPELPMQGQRRLRADANKRATEFFQRDPADEPELPMQDDPRRRHRG